MRRIGFLTLLAAVLVGTPAFAQLGTASSRADIWQTGTGAVPGLYVARQLPNLAPVAPAQPVSNQATPTGWPSWYPQVPGIPVAGGTLVTGITVGTFYDDNVFATNTNRMQDWAFFQRPEFTWVKQGQNYTFAADGSIEGREYARFSSENQINGSLGAGFTVMPDNNTQIVGSARYIHSNLSRGASETVVTTAAGSQLLSTLFAHPVAYDEGLESIALNKRYGNWWSSLGAAGLEITYQNPTIGSVFGVTPLTGTSVDLSYADGAIGAVNARVGYVVMPLTSVFVEVAANTRDWGVSYFDSNGYRLVAGMLFEQGPGGRLKGEFWGGFMNQLYSGTTMSTISSWTYGVSLAVIVIDNVTAVVEGRREAKEAALGLALLPSGALGASAATCNIDAAVCVSTIESTIGGRVDYRIAQNVVVGGGVTYLEDDYQGVLAFGRVDRTLSPLASVKYFASPNITLGFDYRNIAFHSGGGLAPPAFTSVAALPYARNIYLFSLTARW
jgi:Putative beta-barrel porin 2